MGTHAEFTGGFNVSDHYREHAKINIEWVSDNLELHEDFDKELPLLQAWEYKDLSQLGHIISEHVMLTWRESVKIVKYLRRKDCPIEETARVMGCDYGDVLVMLHHVRDKNWMDLGEWWDWAIAEALRSYDDNADIPDDPSTVDPTPEQIERAREDHYADEPRKDWGATA